MAKQTVPPLPLTKHWPRRVRSAAVHAIALARLALTTARYPAGTTFTAAGLPPAGTTNLSRHTWTTTASFATQPMAEIPRILPFTFGGLVQRRCVSRAVAARNLTWSPLDPGRRLSS